MANHHILRAKGEHLRSFFYLCVHYTAGARARYRRGFAHTRASVRSREGKNGCRAAKVRRRRECVCVCAQDGIQPTHVRVRIGGPYQEEDGHAPEGGREREGQE